jgi:hypothetical protein
MTGPMTPTGAAAVSREATARMSAHEAKPDLSGVEAALDERTATHDRLWKEALEAPDADLSWVLDSGADMVRRVAAPFREQWRTVLGEEANGMLTPFGAEARKTVLKAEFERQLDDQAITPLKNRLAAAAQRFTSEMQVAAPSDKHSATAAQLATELRLLTPQRGVQRLADVVSVAAKTDDFNVVRAVIPFVRSLIEQKDSGWYGHEDAYRLVVRMEEAARTWFQDVGASRLEDVAWLEYQLQSMRQAAIESAGDLNRSTRFLIGDFHAKKLRRGEDTQHPRYQRLFKKQWDSYTQQAQAAVAAAAQTR